MIQKLIALALIGACAAYLLLRLRRRKNQPYCSRCGGCKRCDR